MPRPRSRQGRVPKKGPFDKEKEEIRSRYEEMVEEHGGVSREDEGKTRRVYNKETGKFEEKVLGQEVVGVDPVDIDVESYVPEDTIAGGLPDPEDIGRETGTDTLDDLLDRTREEAGGGPSKPEDRGGPTTGMDRLEPEDVTPVPEGGPVEQPQDVVDEVVGTTVKTGGPKAGPVEQPGETVTVQPGEVTPGGEPEVLPPAGEPKTPPPVDEVTGEPVKEATGRDLLDEILGDVPGEVAGPETPEMPDVERKTAQDLLDQLTSSPAPTVRHEEADVAAEERMRGIEDIVAGLGGEQPQTDLEKQYHDLLMGMMKEPGGLSDQEKAAYRKAIDKKVKDIQSQGAYAGIGQGTKTFGKQAEAVATGEAQIAKLERESQERAEDRRLRAGRMAQEFQTAMEEKRYAQAEIIMQQESVARQRDAMNLDEDFRRVQQDLVKADAMHRWGLEDTQVEMAKQLQRFNIGMRQSEFSESQRQFMIEAGFTAEQINLAEQDMKSKYALADKNWGLAERSVALTEKQFTADERQRFVDNGFKQDQVDLAEAEVYNAIELGNKKFDADQIQRMRDNGFTDQQITQAQQQLDQQYELGVRGIELDELKNEQGYGLEERMVSLKEEMALKEFDLESEKFQFYKKTIEDEFGLKLSQFQLQKFIETGRLELDIINTQWQQGFQERQQTMDYMLGVAGLELKEKLGMTQIEVNAAIQGEWISVQRESQIWSNYFNQLGLEFDYDQLAANIKLQRETNESNFLGSFLQAAATIGGGLLGGPPGAAAGAAATQEWD